MYQPKMKERHIRRLYFKAKREGKKMTQLVNEALEDYLYGEPDPPEEGRKDVKNLYRQANAQRHHRYGRSDYPPTREQGQEAQAPPHSLSQS